MVRFLGVVCEGFRGLNIRLLLNNERPNTFQELLPISDAIGTLMKAHSDSLRKFRNNVFHMRENSDFLSHFSIKMLSVCHGLANCIQHYRFFFGV